VDRAELELQLEVWKDLAISKQMLIGAAAEALKIKSDCSMAEIKDAFEKATKRATEADTNITKAEDDAASAIAAMQIKVKESDIAHNKAMEASDKSHEERLVAEHRVNAGREANSDSLKKAKAEIADKDKALKQIKKILHDSPENVVKKLKALKKEKMDEANLRKKAEDDARKQKKEKQKAEQDFKDLESSLEQSAKLVEQIRELKTFSETQYDQLKDLVDDKKSLEKVPALDEELLEAVESLSSKNDKKSDGDSDKGSKDKKIEDKNSTDKEIKDKDNKKSATKKKAVKKKGKKK
jgi:colicin import membrane protein